MLCPSCGRKPFGFAKFLRTLNPLAIQCTHCKTQLRAGPIAYLWTLLHGPIGWGVLSLGERAAIAGFFDSWWGTPTFAFATVALLFCTAYVIPWYAFRGMYRVA